MASEARDSRPEPVDGAGVSSAQGRAPRRLSLEMSGELVLLVICVTLFLLFLYESIVNDWGMGAALMPWIVSSTGLVLVGVRIAMLVRRKPARQPSLIMDTGFRSDEGEDPSVVRGRFLRISAFIIVLYFGIWLFGFHIALPVGIALYLKIWGNVGWIGTVVTGGVFAAIIIGVYDNLVNMIWPEPAIFTLFG